MHFAIAVDLKRLVEALFVEIIHAHPKAPYT
jgi:hypothetical protein